jgi:hypothetical protein
MTALRLQINEKTVYEGPTVPVPRVGEEIHHDGKVVRVEALVWDFASADPAGTDVVEVALTVGTQPYTY